MLTTAGIALRRDSRGELQVFIAKRKAGKYLGSLWEFPGGKAEPGEEAETALHREFREEFGVDIDVQERFCSGQFWGNGKTYHLEAYFITIHGEPVCREHSTLLWVPLAVVFTYTVPPSDTIILGALREYEKKELFSE